MGGDILHMGHQLSHWDIYVQTMGSSMTDFLTVFSFREGLGMATRGGSGYGALQQGRCHREELKGELSQHNLLCPL